ncbi:antitoxin [Aquisalibacillus elongatus]|uniref:CopG family transcriptional regulator/antitoxin EndoAI n=1 Tax=Aquisalibacillus elongatus TaxID=485577 RepID=A0A3N5BHM4_9BACI|nr:antitoxin [Aquisalibacillus elongatus]RPF57093.1 CopG family transcriptional regulator/antitoxin EndoAI [Aquisalibacillus elongatus]
MSESSKEIVLRLPESLLSECDSLVENSEELDRETLIMQAVNTYVQEEKKRKIKDKMRRGYVEMKNINLGIASEAFEAEEEAETTLERLVSGV